MGGNAAPAAATKTKENTLPDMMNSCKLLKYNNVPPAEITKYIVHI